MRKRPAPVSRVPTHQDAAVSPVPVSRLQRVEPGGALRTGVCEREGGGMTVGDYDLRGLDFETYLVGPVTDKIIDADRLVRQRVSNGFPNWALYRCVYAGDTHLLPMLR